MRTHPTSRPPSSETDVPRASRSGGRLKLSAGANGASGVIREQWRRECCCRYSFGRLPLWLAMSTFLPRGRLVATATTCETVGVNALERNQMRRFGVFVVAVMAAALFVFPAGAERGVWNNWHVHDGGSGTVDSTGLTHRGLVFFPQIFGSGYASTPSLWAYCTDATDKALVGGDGGAKHAAGTCRNEQHIIHLLWVDADAPGPEGWSTLTLDGGTTTLYYRLTPR